MISILALFSWVRNGWLQHDNSDDNGSTSEENRFATSDESGEEESVVVQRQTTQDHARQLVADFSGRDLVPAVDRGATSVNLLKVTLKEAPACMNFGKSTNFFNTHTEEEDDATPLSLIQKLRKRTVRHIEHYVPHIFETEGFRRVLQTISSGPSLSILTGRRGDGKTSVGYKVLSNLSDEGRQVFYAITPEELNKICLNTRNSVIMIENICGEFIFDQAMWRNWQPVLNFVLSLSDGGPTVLLVVNNFVLKQWSNRFDNLPVRVSVTDLTLNTTRTPEEKTGILKAMENRFQVILKDHVRQEICTQDVRYGFPKLCAMYLHDNSIHRPVESIFRVPTKLDELTMKRFIQKSSIRALLKRILVLGGVLTISDEPEDDTRFILLSMAKDFEGIFLYRHGDCYKFWDNYMYDLVASTLWEIDKRYVIENCPIAFINRSTGLSKFSSTKHLLLHPEDMKYLLGRFIMEIGKGNLLMILSHEACKSPTFASTFMDRLLKEYDSMERIISLTDTTHKASFAFLSTSSRSCEILKIILSTLKTITIETVNDIVFGICDAASVDALDHLTDRGFVLDMNIQNSLNQTPAMLAANNRCEEFMIKIMSFDVDTKSFDSLGRCLLHYVCENGLPLCTETVLATFEDINIKDKDGRTPLQSACEEKHLPIVKLLTEKGADVDTKSLHEACKSGELAIVKLLLEQGGDAHAVSETGDTLLHSACEGSIGIVDYLLKKGLDINSPGDKGRTPLDKAQIMNNFRIAKHLKAKGTQEKP